MSGREQGEPSRNGSGATAVGILGAVATGVAAVAVYASVFERRHYTLRTVSAAILPPGSPMLRVLHISDIHLAPWQRDRVRWIASLSALEPDLVIDTGDNLGADHAVSSLAEAFAPFARRNVPGVFVDGSNDSVGPVIRNPLAYLHHPSAPRSPARPRRELDISGLHRMLTGCGWKDLNNARATADFGRLKLVFLGTGDAHVGRDDLSALRRLGEETAATRTPDTVVIGITHAPYRRVLDTFVEAGADIVFAGHTHGGQVCLPGVGALTTNCDLPLAQAKGLSTWSTAGRTIPLHVSAGLGTSIYAPIRFACPPEATLLQLEARPD